MLSLIWENWRIIDFPGMVIVDFKLKYDQDAFNI